MFTNRYHGDIYYPTVYQALAMTSQNKTVWNKHKGSITDIAFSDDKSAYMVTCSTYGEVVKHTNIASNQLTSETLVSNPRYDFRDIYIDRLRNVIYALSRSGHLIIIDPDKKVQVLTVNIQNLKELDTTDRQFILFGEEGMALLDTEKRTIIQEKKLPFHIVCASRTDNYPIIFDDKGRMHIVKSFSNIVTSQVPFKGQVTAYVESSNQHLTVYGMSDGSINIMNGKGQQTRLVGHLSRISKVKADGNRLYSSSYDGTLNLWLTNSAKIIPMPLFTTKGWIINFTFDLQKYFVWSGDQNGNLTRALISVPEMLRRLRAKLKRNMTREEWYYYVGRNVPYEEVKK
jgi:WD40 repeat protein